MKEIVLKKGDRCWWAFWLEDNKPDLAIIDLFGDYMLPTGFTNMANAKDVLAHIQKLNPDRQVRIEE